MQNFKRFGGAVSSGVLIGLKKLTSHYDPRKLVIDSFSVGLVVDSNRVCFNGVSRV